MLENENLNEPLHPCFCIGDFTCRFIQKIMGQSAYYHNLTKNWFNENDYGDAVENSDVGDVIKMSFRGNALVIDLFKEDLEIESKGEHHWARKQFLDYFKVFHEVDFLNGR